MGREVVSEGYGVKRGRSTGTPTKAQLVPVPGFAHTYATVDGDIYSDHPNNRWRGALHKLTPADNGRGYLRVRCHGKSRCVHLLVAAALLGQRPEGLEVNHRDGDKRNNRPGNLEYVSRSENMRHAFDNGLCNAPTGEQHHMTTLTEAQVSTLRYDYVMLRDGRDRMPNGAMKHLQRKYGLSDTAINNIVRGVTWKCVQICATS